MSVNKFKARGFFVNEAFPISNIAYLSLRMALKSYISTFRDIEYRIPLFSDPEERKPGDLYSVAYVEHAYEAIIHFQHFTELYIKDILKTIHPLLVVDVGSKHLLLYKLLKGQDYNENEIDSLKQIEFSVGLQRIVELINQREIDAKYDFILNYKQSLEEINKLRNRIAHRGIFILECESLDELFGKYVLPFISEIFKVETKIKKEYYFKTTKSGLSPLDKIIDYYKAGTYNIKEVGLLKEIARATYEDKLGAHPIFEHFNEKKIRKIEAAASYEETSSYGNAEVCTCPVCGQQSFMLYWDCQYDEDEDGNVLNYYEYVYNAVCLNCTFEISSMMYDVKLDYFDLSSYLKNK